MRGDAQVDEARFAHIGRDELAGGLDGGEEEGEVARGLGPEADLIAQYMASARVSGRSAGVSLCTHRVRVMRSVEGGSSVMLDMVRRRWGEEERKRWNIRSGRSRAEGDRARSK